MQQSRWKGEQKMAGMLWKEWNVKRVAVPFRVLIGILVFLTGVIPLLIQSQVLANFNSQQRVESKMRDMQAQCLMIGNKISVNGYMANPAKNAGISGEMQLIADMFHGRIYAVDSNFRIIYDSFGLSTGRITVAEQVIQCFQGESKSNYFKDEHYFYIVTPVYRDKSEQQIEGVLVATSSTEDIVTQKEQLLDRAYMLELLLGGILLILALGSAYFLMKPFRRLIDTLNLVADGKMDEDIQVNMYQETREISCALNTTLTRVKQLDQARQEFVSNVSHELKTPITSIRVLADSLMGMGEAPVELYQEFMSDISDEIDRESKIIDDLLSLVRMDKAAAELNVEKKEINSVIELIMKRLRPIARKRNVELIFESMREVTAEVDEVKISLAINNLVENAIKYNVDGGWVRVTLDADHKFFYIKVADSGIGIPEELQSRVFERFYRVDKARSRESGGTGLGLAITKSVIQMHQGAIRIQSKEGEGTTFTVRVPLKYIP